MPTIRPSAAPPSATSGRTTPPPDERGAAAPPSSTSSKSGSGAYQLSFLFRFDREDDEYSFAYCFPYTYTMLQRELAVMPPSPLLHRTLLTRTELGRRVDLLRFATPRLLAAKRRPVVVVFDDQTGKADIALPARPGDGAELAQPVDLGDPLAQIFVGKSVAQIIGRRVAGFRCFNHGPVQARSPSSIM